MTAQTPLETVELLDEAFNRGDFGKTADGKSTSPPRLPSGWVRLGLTTDQHDKVIAVMVKYAPQIQQLEAQLKRMQEGAAPQPPSALIRPPAVGGSPTPPAQCPPSRPTGN